jgi:hypothetical protein
MMESNIESVMEEKSVSYEDTHHFVITFHSHRRGLDGDSASLLRACSLPDTHSP